MEREAWWVIRRRARIGADGDPDAAIREHFDHVRCPSKLLLERLRVRAGRGGGRLSGLCRLSTVAFDCGRRRGLLEKRILEPWPFARDVPPGEPLRGRD